MSVWGVFVLFVGPWQGYSKATACPRAQDATRRHVGGVMEKKTARTDLVLDKPTGQLLRGAVPLSLDTPDENSPVYSLHVQRAVHGLLLVGVLAFGGGGPRVGGRARRSQVLLGGAVGVLGGHDRTNTGGQLASRGGREGSSRNKAARSCDRGERGKVEEACRRRVWSCRCRASCEGLVVPPRVKLAGRSAISLFWTGRSWYGVLG